MVDDDFIPIETLDDGSFKPIIDYKLRDRDWEQIEERADFVIGHIPLARRAIEYALYEFIQFELTPIDFDYLGANLKHLSEKIESLNLTLKQMAAEHDLYQLLVDDGSEISPTSFDDGDGHPGHEDLVALMKFLEIMANRSSTLMKELPQKKRGPQDHNIKRLVLCIDRTITKCTDRPGLNPGMNNTVTKFNDQELVSTICEIAEVATHKSIGRGTIISAMKAAVASRAKTKADDLSNAPNTSPLFNLILNDGRFVS